jgi:hypothetical protein
LGFSVVGSDVAGDAVTADAGATFDCASGGGDVDVAAATVVGFDAVCGDAGAGTTGGGDVGCDATFGGDAGVGTTGGGDANFGGDAGTALVCWRSVFFHGGITLVAGGGLSLGLVVLTFFSLLVSRGESSDFCLRREDWGEGFSPLSVSSDFWGPSAPSSFFFSMSLLTGGGFSFGGSTNDGGGTGGVMLVGSSVFCFDGEDGSLSFGEEWVSAGGVVLVATVSLLTLSMSALSNENCVFALFFSRLFFF